MGSLADVLEEKAMEKGMAKGMAKGMEKGMGKGIAKGGKIIKLYAQGMSREDIAASLQLDLEYVEDAIANYEDN